MQCPPQLIFIDGSVLQTDLLGFVLNKNLQKRSETLQQQNKIIMILDSVTSRPRVHLFTSRFLSAHQCNVSNKDPPLRPMKTV
jgi:hypothetical protein